MHSVNSRRAFLAITSLALGLLLLGAAAAGCTKSEGGGDAGSAPAAGANAGSPLVAAGKTVYASNGCARCHALGGQGGRNGPDLSRVGAEATHTADWLVAHVTNPKTHNPGSRMPGFAGKIGDKDLLALGAYLASLK